MVMKHNHLFFSISDKNKETWKSLEGEGELKSDSKKKEKGALKGMEGLWAYFAFEISIKIRHYFRGFQP